MTALPVLPAAAQRDPGRCGRCVISTEHRDLARPIKIEVAGDGLPDSSCNIHRHRRRPRRLVQGRRASGVPGRHGALVARVTVLFEPRDQASAVTAHSQTAAEKLCRGRPPSWSSFCGWSRSCFSADSSCALVSFTAGSYPRAEPGRVVGIVPAAAHGDFTFLLGSYTWTAIDPNSTARGEDYE